MHEYDSWMAMNLQKEIFLSKGVQVLLCGGYLSDNTFPTRHAEKARNISL